MGQIILGVSVGILSTSIQSLGLTLQRKSHLLEDDAVSHRPPHRRRRWQARMFLFIVSNILGSSIQITTLPLVILSPLQASGLVFNSVCATLILSEPFTRFSLIGTILVCVGATFIAAFGALKEPAHTLDELLELLERKPFLLWIGAQVILVISILIAAKISLVIFPRTKNTIRMKMLRGISYGAVSGILSADCLLLAKSASELLVRTIVDRTNQFNRWQSWAILLGLAFLALTQLFYLHRGLKICSTSILYPLVFCVYNIIATLDGLLYYRQASRLSAVHSGLIALGVLILLSGVFCLSWRLQDDCTTQRAKSATAGFEFVDTDSENESASPLDEVYHEPESSHRTKNITHSTRTRRCRRAMSQAEEIWGELQDNDEAVPSRFVTVTDSDFDDGANERTDLLRKTPMRRKSRYGFPRVAGSSQTRRISKSAVPQEAIGGWWKLKWWKRKGISNLGELPQSLDGDIA
ncbi:hypothetical protein K440DRAFT_608022 [Wilcoxina mikolae CBS 423.85]|nr:hypothetical protein K440DRAFT_608022 [Wilcoxina mikolae CBS 423.85]